MGSGSSRAARAPATDQGSRPSSSMSSRVQRVAAFKFGATGTIDIDGDDQDRISGHQPKREVAQEAPGGQGEDAAPLLSSRLSHGTSGDNKADEMAAREAEERAARDAEVAAKGAEEEVAAAVAAAAAEEARRLLAIEENFCVQLYTQGLLWKSEGDLVKAEEFYEQAIAAAKERLPPTHPAHADYQKAFELVQEEQGKGPKFEEQRRRAEQLRAEQAAAEKAAEVAVVAERVRKGFGPMRIRQELRQRGLSDDLIEPHLDRTRQEWLEAVSAAHDKKFGPTRAGDLKERARRSRFLEYRGFPADLIAGFLQGDDLF